MQDPNPGTDEPGGGGEETTSFLDGIQSEELKGHESLADFKSHDEIAQAFVDMKGAQPVIPENIDGYSYEAPEGVTMDEAGVNAFKDIALDIKLSADQYNAIVGFRTAEIETRNKAMEAQKEEAVTTMKQEWGDNYDANIQKITKVLATAGTDADALFSIKQPGEGGKALGNEPVLARLLTWVHDKMSPDTFEGGESSGGGKEKTAAEVLYGGS